TLLDYFESYNKKIFPLQIVLAIIAIGLVTFLLLIPGTTLVTILFNAFLSITFIWIAVAFIYFVGDLRRRFSFASYATAAAYLPLAVIFILDIFLKQTAYEISQFNWRFYTSVFIMCWGIILYPLSGYFNGHCYPRVPLFGAMPCPTNIFAIGFLTTFASNQLEITAIYVLSSMAVIGGVKAALIGYEGERIYEDIALLVSGVYGLWLVSVVM
ncbi:hypothetical protein KKB18_04590, partial [bacterium]|nr:hypothetical protein [bacterium]